MQGFFLVSGRFLQELRREAAFFEIAHPEMPRFVTCNVTYKVRREAANPVISRACGFFVVSHSLSHKPIDAGNRRCRIAIMLTSLDIVLQCHGC